MSALMLSPKMQHRIQRGVRINDGQLLGIAEKAKYDSRKSGYLFKRSSDGNRWLRRWFRLYQVRNGQNGFVGHTQKNAKLALWCCFQNLLFYYDQESASKPTGVIFLEGCYTERILSTSNRSGDAPASNGNDSVSDKLVWNTSLLFEDDTNTHLFKCKIAVVTK